MRSTFTASENLYAALTHAAGKLIASMAMLVLSSLAVKAAESSSTAQGEASAVIKSFLKEHCVECHRGQDPAGNIDLSQLSWDLERQEVLERWTKVHDQVAGGIMPPEALTDQARAEFVQVLSVALDEADYRDVLRNGRAPLRRLNRSEYEQNLRDLLGLPHLDIRDMLPEDRESFHFNKSADTLDMTRVQLSAYLDAADFALHQAIARGTRPRTPKSFRALATNMFPKAVDHAGRESSFFAKNSRMVPITTAELNKIRREGNHDPEMEVAIFRSASWPYYGYPEDFVADEGGIYRVRFSARAVRQLREFRLVPDQTSLAMTFRARKPSKADVSGDVRAVGGLIDVQPQEAVYETNVLLKEKETIEYSLMGLPMPFPITSHGGPLYYDFPPMPEGGHRGIAFRWLEIEGPIDAADEADWPPPSHRLLFGDLPIHDADTDVEGDIDAAGQGRHVQVVSDQPHFDARRLLQQFAERAARRPVPPSALKRYEQLIFEQLDSGSSFADAMLTGYQAFLCSSHFLYVHDPGAEVDPYHLASRLSHFLWNTRPDDELLRIAQQAQLSTVDNLQFQTRRMLASPKFDDFIENFTDYWLDLRHIGRDAPDIRLYPEYRFDDYLIESMERETRAFVKAMFLENLPVTTLIDAEFALVNDKLAAHYELDDVAGSSLQKIDLPDTSTRGGLLTQAAIMKVTANGTTTSPVIRGAWIMDRLLGEPPPPPPDKVPAIEPDLRGATTIRQQIAKHAKAAECAACHARFDPVGCALENFDVMGGWRDRYRSLEKGDEVTGIDRAGHTYSYKVASIVDAHGELLDGGSFSDIRDLKRLLVAQPRKLAANMLRQWTVYATGAPLRFSDRRDVDVILDQCAAGGYRIQDLLHAFIASRIFTGAPRSDSDSLADGQ